MTYVHHTAANQNVHARYAERAARVMAADAACYAAEDCFGDEVDACVDAEHDVIEAPVDGSFDDMRVRVEILATWARRGFDITDEICELAQAARRVSI